jgi:glycosyltransferase involved in cell wall biosynthesis
MITAPGMLERDRLLRYDAVVYVMGNSSHHTQAFDLMEKRPGSVMIHEARFTGFFEWHGRHRGHGPEWFQWFLHDEYQGIEPEMGEIGWLTWSEADEAGLYLLGPIIDRAERLLTTSGYTANLARLRRPERTRDVIDIGFGYPPPVQPDERTGVRWIGTFGYQHEIKATDVIVEAFALLAADDPNLRLAIVGDVADELAPLINDLIDSAGLGDRVVVTSRIDRSEYESWLRRVDMAVQLRRASNGEVSAAVGDCLRFGIPTIVTALGATVDLWGSVVAKVDPGIDPSTLAATLRRLADRPDERSELTADALEYVRAHDFDWAARELLKALHLG